MRRALHRVEQVQVVGQYPGLEQALAQAHEDIPIIVDATQQNSLVQQGGAGVAQSGKRVCHRRIELLWMIGMQHEHHG